MAGQAAVMKIRKTELERAFELARSGEFSNVRDLVNKLKLEGYSGYQIEGKSLQLQIAILIENAMKPLT